MFEWITEFIKWASLIVPRLVIIRATHAGVKWRRGHTPIAMLPGLWWYWPITTAVETIVTARQTLELPTQALQTRDRKQVVVGALVVYDVSDVVLAIGEKNWDVDQTINDIAQAAVVEVVTEHTLDELANNVSTTVKQALTKKVRKQLAGFGVRISRCALTNFCEARTLNILGMAKHAHHSTVTSITP